MDMCTNAQLRRCWDMSSLCAHDAAQPQGRLYTIVGAPSWVILPLVEADGSPTYTAAHIRTQPITWRKGSLSGDECHPLEPSPCSKGQSEGMAVIPWALIPCGRGQSADGPGMAVPWPRGWVP
jgi:hypothetical protein